MKARVDPDLCIGCGICPEVCPEVFEMDNNDKARATVDVVPPAAEDACRSAAEQCPQAAIVIE